VQPLQNSSNILRKNNKKLDSYSELGGSRTKGTNGTAISSSKLNQTQLPYNELDENGVPNVLSVPITKKSALEEGDFKEYSQLCCFFCGKAINDNEWLSDSFTDNKPSHKKCYEDTKAQLEGD
jgi:hypothetical protein